MKFFIPFANDDASRDLAWEGIRDRCRLTLTTKILDKKIYKVDFVFDGISRRAEVGRFCEWANSEVIAILETDKSFLICTVTSVAQKEPPENFEKYLATQVTHFNRI